MYSMIIRLISQCAGCKLSRSQINRQNQLVYSFPMDAPFKIVHADICQVGTEQGFNGEKAFMNLLDGMTSYAVS